MEERKIGKCCLKELIGQGAMGTVYMAHHETLRIPVAVKTVPASAVAERPQFAQSLMEEAHLAATLNHPNIVRVYDCGQDGGHYYVVMELVEGRTCADRIEKDGPIPWREAVEIVCMVADALRYAAAQGIIHRDVKPANIMLVPSGCHKLADLGMAKRLVKEAASEAGQPSGGTPLYMSPEHFTGRDRLDFRSDVYCLGATLYHMVCGRVPFPAVTYRRVRELHLREPLESPRIHAPEVPESLCDVTSRMMAKEPKNRYQSYDHLIADLRKASKGRGVSAAGSELRLQARFVPRSESIEGFEETRRFNFADVPLSFNGAMAKVYALLSLLAASAGVLILSYLVRAALGFAAGWGLLALLLVGWVVLTRRRLRSGTRVTGEESEGRRAQRAFQILERLCSRTGIERPRLYIHRKGKGNPLSAGLFPSTSSVHIHQASFGGVPLSDLEMEALVASEVGRIYNGDSAFMTLLLAPIALYYHCGAPLRKLYGAALSVSGALWPALVLSFTALLSAAALLVVLFLVSFWLGVAGCTALFLYYSLHAFQRHSQYAADVVAAELMSQERSTMSLAAKIGLASGLERPLMLRELGVEEEGVQKRPEEQALQRRMQAARAVRQCAEKPAAFGLVGTSIEWLIHRPLATSRIWRLSAGRSQHPTARLMLAGPIGIYLRIAGRAERKAGSSHPFVERIYPHVPAAALAGVLTACVTLGFVCAGYAYAWLAPLMATILSFVLGALWALRCMKDGYLPGESAFGLLLMSYGVAFSTMVVFAFFGPRYLRPAFSFPSIFLLSIIFALLGDVAISRLSAAVRGSKTPADDARQRPGSVRTGNPR